MKRLLCFFTVLAICMSNLCIYAADGNVGEKEAEILKNINIYTSSEIAPSVTRGDFAAIAAKMLGQTKNTLSKNNKQVFIDVDENTKNSEAIAYVFENGIMIGYDDASFMPDNKLTCSEAVKTMVLMLGYEISAQAEGGYYTGYRKIASSTGIMKGVKCGYDDVIDTGNLAILIMNTLKSNVMSVVLRGSEVTYITDHDITFMEKYLDMNVYQGVVTGYDFTSLESETKEYPKGSVEIGGITFDGGNVNAEDYLGMKVDAYYVDNDGDYTLMYITERQNRTVTVGSDYIESADLDKIEYYPNEERTKLQTFKIAEDAIYIYNGKKNVLVSKFDLLPNCGTVKLVDNNGDSKADVVIINDYIEFIVSNVLAVEEKVIGKYNAGTMDLGDEDIEFYMNEELAAFTDIAKDSVLNIAQSKNTKGKKVTKVFITNEMFEAKVTSVNKSEDKIKISADSEEYEFSALFTELYKNGNAGTLKNNDSYKFKLNMFGEIADMKIMTGSKKYAYVIRNNFDDEDEIRYIKMYTSEGEFIRAPLKDKVSLNGERVYARAADIDPYQLIIYDMDSSGNISKIMTATDKTDEKWYVSKDDEFTKNHKSTLKTTTSNGVTTTTYSNIRFYKNYAENLPFRFMKGESIYFQIPDDKSIEKDYKIITDLGSTDVGVKGPIEIYDAKEGGIIGVMVAGELGGSSDFGKPQMVDNISQVLDDDDNPCTQINFIGGGSVILSEDVKFTQPPRSDSKGGIQWSSVVDYSGIGVDDLKYGDVIQFVKANGYATEIMVVVAVNNIGPVRVDGDHIAKNGNVICEVMSVSESGSNAIVRYVDRYGEERYQTMGVGGTVIKYDSATRKADYTTASDIRKGDILLLNSFWWSIQETFIFR